MQNMDLNDVRRALELPRPGRDAQIKLSPRPRPGDVFPLPLETNVKNASVLILLYPGRKDDLNFFLTRRTEKVETHKGQISLPGGMQEPGEKPWETALREAAEELHIDTNGVQVFHKPLTQVYIPVSGFRVTPYVGYADHRLAVDAAPDEVVEVIETPLEIIVDKKYQQEEEWELRNFKAMVPFYCVNGYKVWGATAMILAEFGEMLRLATVGA
jgi:8-oxo-dGTP pyrophosphatase MutT (NUDIX family)